MEFFRVEGGPEVLGEDFGVKTLGLGEVLVFVDGGVDAAGFHDVSEHDFAALERGVPETFFEKF